jgi:hypothetical protein
MGIFRQRFTGVLCGLEHQHVIGRSALCELRVDEPYVSQHHAAVRWSGRTWELKDLGSLNGTSVNGAPIPVGVATPLTRGDRIAIGHVEQCWELVEDGRPRTMVVPLDGRSPPIPIEGSHAVLPSAHTPSATIFRGVDGGWYLEQLGSVETLRNRATFEVAGGAFQFYSAETAPNPSTEDVGAKPVLARMHLFFRVSANEEHVEIRAAFGNRVHHLGSRIHNYPLLLLARQRLSDACEGHPSGECGWMYQDTFADQLRMSPSLLTIQIHRIRRQFDALGIIDFAGVVERRPATKQLRIGVASLAIDPI